METKQTVKGYKVFNSDLTCRGFQFEIGKEYKHEGQLKICNSGFHFCTQAAHCFSYYDFDPKNIVCEVEALGEIQTHYDDSKVATNHIRIIRQLDWQEVLIVSNQGKNNTGHSNSGDSNSGDSNSGNSNSGNWNSGDSNSGDSNSGNRNSGDSNSGNWNSGDRNSGNSNSGNWNSGNSNSGNWNSGNSNSGNWNSGNSNSGDSNSGNWNSGDWNSGNSNSGNWNSGNRNSGDSNSGNWNSGDRNSGNSNSGNWNSGNRNSGNSNSGNWNSGNRNSGDSNSGYRSGGAFCTEQNPFVILFDKPSNILVKDWEISKAVEIMYSINTTIWIPWSLMTEEERKVNPKYKASEGYTKSIPMKEAWSNAWNNWSQEYKDVFLNLPNFDADKFEEITGIKTK